MKKRLKGAALELPPGLTCSRPCKPEFWKNDLPANLFFAACTPPKCKKVTPAFYYFYYKHTFWDVFEKLRHVWVLYISKLVCVRKHESNLPNNICTTCTVKKKTQWYEEKCNLLSETTFLCMPYFMAAGSVFFYQWCLSCFSSQQYMFLWLL